VRPSSRSLSLVAVGFVLGWSVCAAAQPPEEFRKRRDAVRAKMEPGSVLVLRGAARVGESFRQENNLLYLTGINEPNTALVLYGPRPEPQIPAEIKAELPDGFRLPPPPTEVLYIQPSAPQARPAPGAVPPAARLTRPGFDTVRAWQDFQEAFEAILTRGAGTSLSLSATGADGPQPPPVVYVDLQRSRRLLDPLTSDEQWLRAARDRGANVAFRSASALVRPLRAVKSPAEIERITAAMTITGAAQREAMRAAKPGMFEYQLQAVIEHVFLINGARRPAFASIIGSGPNGIILHWSENTRQTQPGDMVVMDVGAEYDLYAADITRTIPISGTFTTRQRDIYETVLRANQEAIAMIAPGVAMREINARVNGILTEGLLRLGLIKDKGELRKYYTHGLSHGVGLQVHDVGEGVLQAGMVLTIEPGLYIPEEATGVRIEDTVLVTEGGHKVLSADVPKAVAEIEALMRQDGIDYSRYLVNKKVDSRQ